jgi:hypothetical protein
MTRVISFVGPPYLDGAAGRSSSAGGIRHADEMSEMEVFGNGSIDLGSLGPLQRNGLPARVPGGPSPVRMTNSSPRSVGIGEVVRDEVGRSRSAVLKIGERAGGL